MTKNHLKRLNSPKAWPIKKKGIVYVTRPNIGSHSLNNSIPLIILLRDMLGYAKTSREARYIITSKTVMVDGKRRNDYRYNVGIFAVLSLPDMKKDFRLLFNENDKFSLKEIGAGEAALKPLKVTGKNKVKGKTQVCFSDGRTMLLDKDSLKIGDVIIYNLLENKIKDTIKLAKGAMIMLTGGKHLGDIGIVEDIINTRIIYKNRKGQSFDTLKKYAFVIGEEKPALASLAE